MKVSLIAAFSKQSQEDADITITFAGNDFCAIYQLTDWSFVVTTANTFVHVQVITVTTVDKICTIVWQCGVL